MSSGVLMGFGGKAPALLGWYFRALFAALFLSR